MTDEPDVLTARLNRPLHEMSVDELMALKAELEARGIRIYNAASPDEIFLAAIAAVYAKAFVERLGQSSADGLREAVRTRFRKKGKDRELLVGPEDGAAAILVITSETHDEARLAVLDLDVTAEDVRGQHLRWDPEASKWCPESKKL